MRVYIHFEVSSSEYRAKDNSPPDYDEWHKSFDVFTTNAPPEYDYGYTIELYNCTTPTMIERIVMIPREQGVAHQRGRYESGLYQIEPIDEDVSNRRWVLDVLTSWITMRMRKEK